MLRILARAFEFKQTSISKNKLRWILIMMVLSLPVWPLMMLDFYDVLPSGWVSQAAFVMIIAGLISMGGFVCTRFVNRFYFTDKYLDEWEVRIKHKSMTFAFMAMMWVVAPMSLILIGTQDYSFNLSGLELSLWLLGFVLILLYLQTFHALWQVRPIDED